MESKAFFYVRLAAHVSEPPVSENKQKISLVKTHIDKAGTL